MLQKLNKVFFLNLNYLNQNYFSIREDFQIKNNCIYNILIKILEFFFIYLTIFFNKNLN